MKRIICFLICLLMLFSFVGLVNINKKISLDRTVITALSRLVLSVVLFPFTVAPSDEFAFKYFVILSHLY